MRVISKDKPKGKEYSINKKMKKAKRLEEEKKFRRITENKRKNAENRKERRMEKAELEKASQVKLVDYQKGMLLVEIEGKIEKRALNWDREKEFGKAEIKLYGNNWEISKLENFEELKDLLLWKIDDVE